VAATLVATLFTIAPARAVTGGSPDASQHPNVGALVANFPSFSFPICSGTLISPKVFLTAGHCIFFSQLFGATGYSVSFDPALTFDSAGAVNNTIPASSFALDPQFGHDQGDFHDLAVITFASPVSGITPATLPTSGLLDQLAAHGGLRGQTFTTVGYGATGVIFGGGRPQPGLDFVRRVAAPPFMALDATRLFMLINQNATGGGGPCYGDSGGPQFLAVGGADVLVSLTSFKADTVCRALDVNYRLDTSMARAFLQNYVALP
jgi:hypothetical protein